MAKSYRTQQRASLAERRIARDASGEVVLPRIIARKPRPGDRHLLTGAMLRRALRKDVPIEYLYGLKRIELRPRTSDEVGEPFALYFRRERTIVLYSLPLSWTWPRPPSEDILRGLLRFYAEVTVSPAGMSVHWPVVEMAALWFFVEVFAHELGHHYRNQYRFKRGSPGLRVHEEFVANLHSQKFLSVLVKEMKARRKTAAP